MKIISTVTYYKSENSHDLSVGSGGLVVKTLSLQERDPGFDPQPSHGFFSDFSFIHLLRKAVIGLN